MATGQVGYDPSNVQIDPSTGERIEAKAAQTQQIDPRTGERVDSSIPPSAAPDAWKAMVYSRMLGTNPGSTYQNIQTVDQQMRQAGGDFDSFEMEPTIANDVKAGLQDSIFGLKIRKKLPDQVRDPGVIDKFVSGIAEMMADIPFYIGGAVAGGAAGSEVPIVGNVVGAAAGAFAVPAAVRETLVLGIKNGDVQGFGDLMRRAADVTWAGTKGAVVGAATELAGGLPVGSLIARSGAASIAMKGLYQATAMTTAADLLEGRLPTANDFAGNAALMVPLNLVTHGMSLRADEARQASMDVYARDGTTPEKTTTKLEAQPPVTEDMPPGLKPAIQMGDAFVEADEGETHPDLAERVMGKAPVSMDRLEADPTLADEVLQNPAPHLQEVIDKAWELKKEALAQGEQAPYEYRPLDTSSPVSGTFYHGTKAPIESVAELDPGSHGNEQALYGIGTYLTDNPKVARGYAETRGKGPIGKVLHANVQNANLLDLEKPLPPGVHEVFETAIQGVTGDDEKLPTGLSGKQLFRRLQEAMEDQGYPRSEAQDVLGELTTVLRQRGFEGLRHEGGSRFGGGPHNVVIVFPDYGVGRPTTDIVQEAGREPTIEELYNRGEMKSGRGFTTPDGRFLSREQARAWVKQNEPAVHEMWENAATQEKEGTTVPKGQFHANDYANAKERVGNRNVAEGEPDLSAASQQLNDFLKTARSELNTIKAADKASSYGKSVLRTLFVGPRNMLRADAEQAASRMRKLLPDYRDQEAVSFLRDYRDDPQALRAEIEEIRAGSNEKLKALLPSMERALNPSPQMLQADRELTQYFGKALDLGRQLGILDSGIDPARYSPRLFMRVTEDAENARGVGRPKFTEKTPNAIRREHMRLLDPLKSGDFEARTFNALDELEVYADRFSTAASTKLFTTELKNSALGVVGSHGTVPEGWVELAPNQRGFHQTMTIKNAETGENVTFSHGLYVPKVVADAMKPMLEAGGLPTQLAKALHAQSYVKAIELSLSPFHMKALTVTAMNNMSLGDFTRALASDNSSPAFESVEREAALWGLETTKTGAPYEAYRGLKPSSLPRGLDKLNNAPVLKQVDAFAQSLTHETFDVIQRKFKVMDFSQKQARWIAKNPDATEAQYGSAMRGIAKEVNSAYGGLNWDVLGVSKGMRDLSRLFILAPDWTFSNVANLKYSFEGGPAGGAARAFWVKSFATGMALTAGASVMIGGKYDFSGHPMSVYLGKDKDGKDMYSNWFFAGAPKDAITLTNRVIKDGPLEGMVGFMANKFGPIASTLLGLMENKQRTGAPISPKTTPDLDAQGNKIGSHPTTLTEKSKDQAEFAAGNLLPIPFGIKSISDLLTDPKTDTSKWDYVLPLLGMYVTHEKDASTETRTRGKSPIGAPRTATRRAQRR